MDSTHATAQSIAAAARDPLVYPQLDSRREVFQRELTFAQRLRFHIDFCVEETAADATDPQQCIIY